MSDNDTVTTPDGSVITGVEPPARVSLTPAPTPDQPPVLHPADAVFTKEDIEKAQATAREQEKDKLYNRLEGLQSQVQTLADERQARLDEDAARQAQAEAEANARAEQEMDLRLLLDKRQAEFEEKLAEIRNEREHERAVFEKERQYNELQAYKAQALAAASEDVLPELLDEVRGNTAEEIDASIARLADKTSRILGNVEQSLVTARQQQPGVRVTAPPAGPLDNESANRMPTAEEVAAMSMDEFAAYRAKTGLARASNSRGLFG